MGSDSVHLPLRIITHNVRYATSSPGKNERPWQERFPLIISQLSYHTRYLDGMMHTGTGSSFICLQEVLHSQLTDILGALNDVDGTNAPDRLPEDPRWAHIGVARDDGMTKGEYNPIFYPVKLFNLLHFENCWLSPTPNKPSKGWDAGCKRILTTGVFEHKATRQRLAIFNTHLDHAGSKAREKSIVVILEVTKRVCNEWAHENARTDDGSAAKTSLNHILTGDFNSMPDQEAYEALAASGTVIDAYETVPRARRYGDEITFTGFQPDTNADKDERGRIDFVFLGPKSAVQPTNTLPPFWRVKGYAVLPNVFDQGVFSSDHRAVVADVILSR